ncbi:MAG TPA: hypothetical protein VNX86_16775 [Rhizomicrobium sp.]|jgi:hypothetical protein|nr:hypothetical protein [Rhizomicrobium sp.]
MIAQCWLHIGTEKTGSTSIRNYLALNRAALLSQGYLYPRTPGATSHYALTAFALDDARIEGTRRTLGIGNQESVSRFRAEFVDSLEKEIATSGAKTVIFSNELLSSSVRSPSEVARIKALCDAIARQTKIVVYLRNQTDFLVSRYTNIVWGGGTNEFQFRGRPALADYSRLLDRWAQAFGRENIVARRFELADFPGGDLLADFAGATGLDHTRLRPVSRFNESLDAESLAFLRAINRRLPHGLANRISPFRGRIVRVLQQRRGGTKFIVSSTLAEQIEEAFRGSNELVSNTYFESRFHPLFSRPLLAGPPDALPKNDIGPLAALGIAGFLTAGLAWHFVKARFVQN